MVASSSSTTRLDFSYHHALRHELPEEDQQPVEDADADHRDDGAPAVPVGAGVERRDLDPRHVELGNTGPGELRSGTPGGVLSRRGLRCGLIGA